MSGCPHPAALVCTGQVDGSTPAPGQENLLGTDGGAAEAEEEQEKRGGEEQAEVKPTAREGNQVSTK